MKNLDAGTITRIILLVLALVNTGLGMAGYNLLPIDEEAITTFINMAFLGVTSILAMWKNNSVTKEAKQADAKMKQLKAEKKLAKVSGKSPVKENIDTEGDI